MTKATPLKGVRCPRGHEVTRDKGYVSSGYYCACLVCDEDFYEIELVKTEQQKVKDSGRF